MLSLRTENQNKNQTKVEAEATLLSWNFFSSRYSTQALSSHRMQTNFNELAETSAANTFRISQMKPKEMSAVKSAVTFSPQRV